MVLKSYTFSKEELWKVVKPLLVQCTIDVVETAIEEGDPSYFTGMTTYRYNLNHQINLWCECCSEAFFDQHPDISDVLVLTEHKPGDIPMKIWIASK